MSLISVYISLTSDTTRKIERMKISLIVAAGIAVVAAKKPKLIELEDAKERGVVEESMLDSCGGKPEVPANAKEVNCQLSSDKTFIWCTATCLAGYRPDSGRPGTRSWNTCDLDHAKESRRKFGKPLEPCVPLCPDMNEALKTLNPDIVHVQREVRDGWRRENLNVPMIKFSCIDRRDQLFVKGRFQNLFHRATFTYNYSPRISSCYTV